MIKKFKPFSGFCPVPVLPSSQAAATSYMQHLAYLEWYIAQLQAMIEQGGSVVANPEMIGDEPDLTSIQIGDIKYAISEGGSVVANPEMTGDEPDLTSIQIGDIKYAIPEGSSVIANPEMTGDEPDLTGIQIGDTKYAVPEGGTEYQPEILSVYGLIGDPATDDTTVVIFQGYKFGTKLSVESGKIAIGAGVHHVKISGSANLFYTGTPTADTGTFGINKNGSSAGIQGYAPLPDGSSYVMDIELMPQIIEVAENDVLEPYILNLSSGFTSNTVNVYVIAEVID